MGDIVIEVENASAFIPGGRDRIPVLKNISLKLARGAHMAVMGPNGAGKSCLLKLLGGHLPVASGSIAWADGSAFSRSPIIGRRLCGLISPHTQLMCQTHAWDVSVVAMLSNPETTIACASAADPEKLGYARELLERLDASGFLAMRLPQLSRGQLKLALLVRELARRPQVLLLDEWAGGLDQRHARLADKLLGELADETAMVFSGHRDLSVPDWIAQKHYLEAGCLSGMPQVAEPQVIRLHGQPSHGAQAVNSGALDMGKPVFRLQNASVFVNRELVLAHVDWNIRAGEHWWISGANGSGKSTLLRLLAGDEVAAAGGSCQYFARSDGREIRELAQKRKLIRLVADLAEARYDYPLSALHAVLSGLDGSVGNWREHTDQELAWARDLLAIFFPHSDIGDRSIRQLSTGQLRKVFLARAMIGKPEVLLLDEPMAGLDWQSRQEFGELLATLAAKADWRPQIIMVSHHDEDMPPFINRQARLEHGKLEIGPAPQGGFR